MTKTIRCKDAGVDCDFVVRGETEEELFRNALEHGRTFHGMTEIPPDLQDKMRMLIREEKRHRRGGFVMRSAKLLPVGLIAVFVFMAMGGGALAMDHAVKVMKKDGVGSYLTDAKGMTLYWFKKDAPGKSACAGPCVAKWPIYHRETVAPGEGTKAEDYGTITREDGRKQTTFRGYPLYYWAGDNAPGDTKGQGVGTVWYVIDPADFPPKM